MNLLNKLTIKNLKLNKKRTIVTIIGIMLSVALITAVSSIYASGIKSLIKFETEIKGNYHVAFYNVDMEDIDIFEENRNIDKLNITKNIGYAKIDSKNEDKPYAFLKAFTSNSLNNLSVKIISGRLPKNDSEIVIPSHLKTNGRLTLNVGDTITLNVGKRVLKDLTLLNQSNPYQSGDDELEEMIIDTSEKTYKIVGIIERPDTSIEEYSAPGYTFITYIDESELTGNVDVYTRFTKSGLKDSYGIVANIIGVDKKLYKKVNCQEKITNSEMDEFLKQMENAKYYTNINAYLITLETNPITGSGIGGLGVVVSIVIGIIVFTSIFCIKNSFDISITEKTKQYGMLRSIGATQKQIKKNVFYEATILGLIGIPFGLISGFIATFILIIVSNYFLNGAVTSGLELEFAFSFISIVIAIVLGIVTIYFSAFRSARRASKVSPIDSIRNSGNIKINFKNVKSPKIIKKVFGMGGDISFKNLKRNKKKYRTTVISIVVSVFVFIALSGFMSQAFDKIEREFEFSDYNISLFASSTDDISYRKFIDTTKFENIENYTIFRSDYVDYVGNPYSKEYLDYSNIEINSSSSNYIKIISLGNEQYKKFIKSIGQDYDNMKDKAILMDFNKVYYNDKENKEHVKSMRTYKFNKGDIIDVKVKNTEQIVKMEIGEVTQEKPFGLLNYQGEYLILSDKYYEEISSDKALTIYFKTTDANKLQNVIDDYLKGEDYSIKNINENVKTMNKFFTLVGIFLYGFIIVISLIGITNVFNTITTSMELRKREFAMLKSIGMTNKEFNRMIRLESLFIGIKSLLFGVPIGIGLSYLIHFFLTTDEGLGYKIPTLSILIVIAVVFILISLIMKYSIIKINKQNTIETIRNENI